MSIMQCFGCDKMVDTDFNEFEEVNGNGYCMECIEGMETDEDAKLTNVELVTHMMEYAPTGALSQLMIITAIEYYAEMVIRQKLDPGGLINQKAWIRTAEYIRSEIKKAYGN